MTPDQIVRQAIRIIDTSPGFLTEDDRLHLLRALRPTLIVGTGVLEGTVFSSLSLRDRVVAEARGVEGELEVFTREAILDSLTMTQLLNRWSLSESWNQCEACSRIKNPEVDLYHHLDEEGIYLCGDCVHEMAPDPPVQSDFV